MPTVAVNGIELYYEQNGTGTPLILVHGNGEDHTIFNEIIPMLMVHFTVFALDSRGHGNSTKVDAFDYQSMANDIVSFIDALGLSQSRPVFYGFSDGGILGLLIASQHPDLFSKLIVSGANVFPKGMRARWLLLFKLLYRLHKDPKIKMMLEQPDISAQQLASISIPTLVLAGTHDMVSRTHTQYIASQIPGSTLKFLSGEGHGSYVVHSTKLYPLITEFCE